DHVRPALTPGEQKQQQDRTYCRAEVHLAEGGQDYDIMGWTQDAVIDDILDQYERHRTYLHLVHGEQVDDSGEETEQNRKQ
ncbi:MAG TPA: hypothetical protein VK032_02040, partial [Burkholderiaceae bacterium]|nr:hypothetical protein [Burkholderiaceae bacterium]